LAVLLVALPVLALVGLVGFGCAVAA